MGLFNKIEKDIEDIGKKIHEVDGNKEIKNGSAKQLTETLGAVFNGLGNVIDDVTGKKHKSEEGDKNTDKKK